jgi:hypothetical protein
VHLCETRSEFDRMVEAVRNGVPTTATSEQLR